jgi:hypothetical protein
MKYLSISIMIISFLVGILFMYLSKPELKVLHVSPDPENCKTNTYKDKTGKCFAYEAVEVACGDDITETKVEI